MENSSQRLEVDSQSESIVLTDKAQLKTLELANTEEYAGCEALRVYLAGKGCGGFTYGVQFDELREGDLTFTQVGSVVLVCDRDSYVFLKGSTIDYVDDERGQGYWVDNPRHRQYRGKFYKKKVWQDALEKRKEEHVSQ